VLFSLHTSLDPLLSEFTASRQAKIENYCRIDNYWSFATITWPVNGHCTVENFWVSLSSDTLYTAIYVGIWCSDIMTAATSISVVGLGDSVVRQSAVVWRDHCGWVRWRRCTCGTPSSIWWWRACMTWWRSQRHFSAACSNITSLFLKEKRSCVRCSGSSFQS